MLSEMSKSDVVIRVEGLGKKYSLNHAESEGYTALRDVLVRQARSASLFLNPFTLAGQLRQARHKVIDQPGPRQEDFWALKNVSFEIRRGDRVGIIGRNGAGKSTLLKILSRITEPTKGRVEICGRLASLLEVGTGFHPELTGRENIYLNGAILGMRRREIRSKFDEIVDFAEVEKFLDTPVKRYSSGMYVRLAFAVAAHLEPEILVVDEVLAVGDAQFQSKCFNKIEGDKGKKDQTILFVSHNTDALRRLCDKGCLIENGQLRYFGEIENSLSMYLSSNPKSSFFKTETKIKSESMSIKSMKACQNSSKLDGTFVDEEPISIEICGYNSVSNPSVGIKVWDNFGTCVGHFVSEIAKYKTEIPRGDFSLTCKLPPYTFKQGLYHIEVYCSTPFVKTYCHHPNAISFRIATNHQSLSSYPSESINSSVSPLHVNWISS